MARVRRKEEFVMKLNRLEMEVIQDALSTKSWNDVARRTAGNRARDLIAHALG